MKITDCSPIVYHVPIVVGDSDEYYTYYIMKKPIGMKVPLGVSVYAKLVNNPLTTSTWFIYTTLSQITRAVEDTSHNFIAPEHPEGFDSPEEALEQLLYYRKQTYGAT